MGGSTENRKYDLEERLIQFGVDIVHLIDKLPNSKAGNYIGSQLLRSGLAPALNYGEAQGAESRADFIHKMKITLKELRESLVSLKLIYRLKLSKDEEHVTKLLDEANQLVSIFVKSIATTKHNTSK